MGDMPVFQEPGGERATDGGQATKSDGTKPCELPGAAEVPETAPPLPSDMGRAETPRQRRTSDPRAKKRQQSHRFPVATVTAHPMALAKAQDLIATNPSYTKILPGDIPGSVIIR